MRGGSFFVCLALLFIIGHCKLNCITKKHSSTKPKELKTFIWNVKRILSSFRCFKYCLSRDLKGDVLGVKLFRFSPFTE
jgi:hypothetical protein